MEVDSKGTGENFTPAKIIANGNGVRITHRTRYPHTHTSLRLRAMVNKISPSGSLEVLNAVVVPAIFVSYHLLGVKVMEIAG